MKRKRTRDCNLTHQNESPTKQCRILLNRDPRTQAFSIITDHDRKEWTQQKINLERMTAAPYSEVTPTRQALRRALQDTIFRRYRSRTFPWIKTTRQTHHKRRGITRRSAYEMRASQRRRERMICQHETARGDGNPATCRVGSLILWRRPRSESESHQLNSENKK